MMIRLFSVLIGLSVLGLRAQESAPEGLEVTVTGIRDSGGEIGVAVFNAKTGYPVQIEHALETEWVTLKPGLKTATVLFDSLATGEYAVSVLHDENGNRKLERSAVGFPKEGVGFSRNCKVTLRAPRYKECKFALAAGEMRKLTIPMDYRHAEPPLNQPKKSRSTP